MSETPSKRRKRGREDYDPSTDWEDCCPYPQMNQFVTGPISKENRISIELDKIQETINEIQRKLNPEYILENGIWRR